MCAAEMGYTDCVRLLLDAGADTKAKDDVRVGCYLELSHIVCLCLSLAFPLFLDFFI